jgi:histidinol-phosphate aminotransferase
MLKKVRLPYNLSSITQTIAASILSEGKSTVDEYIDRTIQERAWLTEELRKNPTFSVVSSEANFVFFKINIRIDSITLRVGLNEHDVYLRTFEYPGRGVFIRFTVGEHSQNISALNALVRICQDNVKKN